VDPSIAGFIGTILGGGITYFLNRQMHKQQLSLLQEQYKTEFMAEVTARHYLSEEPYTARTFEKLKKRLGGFEDNELRKILVRAGAVRIFGKNDKELWRLLNVKKGHSTKK